MQSATDNQLRELARKRVDFRKHLITYLIINGLLWAIWFVTGAKYPWPVWPTAGWGIGLIFHYIFEFNPSHLLSEEEEFKKIKKKMEEEKNVD
jgi:hypothetical protein